MTAEEKKSYFYYRIGKAEKKGTQLIFSIIIIAMSNYIIMKFDYIY